MNQAEHMKKLWESPEFRERMKHRTRKSKEELAAIKINKRIRAERRELKKANIKAKRSRRTERKRIKEFLAARPIPIIPVSDTRPWKLLRLCKVTVIDKETGKIIRVPFFEAED